MSFKNFSSLNLLTLFSSRMFLTIILLFVTIVQGNISPQPNKLLVDPNTVTMSGFSSGGAMTMQFHLSHSKLIHGVGIFGGCTLRTDLLVNNIPYACGYFSNSTLCHTIPDDDYLNEIRRQEDAGNIDPLEHVQNDSIYIFHGALDSGINPGDTFIQFNFLSCLNYSEPLLKHFTIKYIELGVKISNIYTRLDANVTTEFNIQAEHGFPTVSTGAPCAQNSLASVYINNCTYHGAYHVLNKLYGGQLLYPATTRAEAFNGTFTTFNQNQYVPPEFGSSESISMDSTGFIYIPTGCRINNTMCQLHLALHGCRQSRSLANDTFPTQSGYIEIGELNNIIIIFPQAMSTVDTINGCWNWWGYLEGSEYLNKKAPQIQTLYNIIQDYLFIDEE